jgi:threonine aldolase
MYFASDNCAGIHPAISAGLSAQGSGFTSAYGTSDLDREVELRFGEIFERDVAVFYVSTGTAANALALTLVAKPGGVVFAHREAHIVVTECGAPEFLSGQLRMASVDGPNGKMDVNQLRRQVEELANSDVHGGRPVAISVTQTTESGTVHSLAELDAIATVAKDFNIALHMDGARFANSLVSLGCSPAEMTWKRGVDMLSFGATKNGCWCAEAIVLFDPSKASELTYIHKRSAQLFSKSRFISAQLNAYFCNGLWLDIAQHSNSMAKKLAETIAGLDSNCARLTSMPQSSEVFAIINIQTITAIRAKGVIFCEWPASPDFEIANDEQLCRFVASFATSDEDISCFHGVLHTAAKQLHRSVQC